MKNIYRCTHTHDTHSHSADSNDGCTSIIRIKLNNSEPEQLQKRQMFAGKISVDINIALKMAAIVHAHAN